MSYNILLIGKRGVGKTSFVNHLMGKEFNYEYRPSSEMCINSVKIEYCDSIFNIWDYSIDDNIREDFILNSDAVIYMYDVNEKDEFDVRNLYNIVKKSNKDIPIFCCGNKLDLLKPENNYSKDIFDMSVKDNINNIRILECIHNLLC